MLKAARSPTSSKRFSSSRTFARTFRSTDAKPCMAAPLHLLALVELSFNPTQRSRTGYTQLPTTCSQEWTPAEPHWAERRRQSVVAAIRRHCYRVLQKSLLRDKPCRVSHLEARANLGYILAKMITMFLQDAVRRRYTSNSQHGYANALRGLP